MNEIVRSILEAQRVEALDAVSAWKARSETAVTQATQAQDNFEHHVLVLAALNEALDEA